MWCPGATYALYVHCLHMRLEVHFPAQGVGSVNFNEVVRYKT